MKGESSFGVEPNVEKTIVNGANESSFTNSLDKVAIENFITNLQHQVDNGAESNTVNDILTTEINLTRAVPVAETAQNVSSSSEASKLSIDEEATKKLENNLSTTSSSQSESASAQADINEDINDMVNKIVQDAVVKAKQMIEEEDKLIVDSFEMVEKSELTEKELEQIASEEQKSIDLREVKLNVDETGQASIDPNTSSIAYTSASPAAKSANQTAIVNESNTTLNSSKKPSNKKSPDVDCFSCTVL